MKIEDIKVGGIYKLLKSNGCAATSSGNATYIKVTETSETHSGYLYYKVLDKNKNQIGYCCGCIKPEDLIEIGKESKSRPVKYIVGWREGRDPYKTFSDEKEMKKFLKELGENTNVDKSSVEVFEVKSHQKVTYGTTFKLKKV